MLAQNLKRIADWCERPLRCLALSAATNVMALFLFVLSSWLLILIRFPISDLTHNTVGFAGNELNGE